MSESGHMKRSLPNGATSAKVSFPTKYSNWSDLVDRIAELEAENERLDLGARMAISAHNDLEKLLEQAEAELASIQARRCETCERLNKPNWHCPLLPLDPPADFSCSRWAERTTP